MAQSIKLGSDTYIDSSAVMMLAGGASRRTLKDNFDYSSSTFSVTMGSATQTATVGRKNWFAQFILSVGSSSGTPFSSFSSGDTIGTVPAGYRPYQSTTFTMLMRDNALWASANYIPVYVTVDTNGDISVRGNEAQIRAMKFLIGTAQYCVAG